MPKNQNGEVYCINDEKHTMEKGKHPYMVPSVKIPEKDDIFPEVKLTEGFFLDIYCCRECGYIEMYDNIE